MKAKIQGKVDGVKKLKRFIGWKCLYKENVLCCFKITVLVPNSHLDQNSSYTSRCWAQASQ